MAAKNTPRPEDETFNANYTAIPKDTVGGADADLVSTPAQYGEMNEKDARESGYVTAADDDYESSDKPENDDQAEGERAPEDETLH